MVTLTVYGTNLDPQKPSLGKITTVKSASQVCQNFKQTYSIFLLVARILKKPQNQNTTLERKNSKRPIGKSTNGTDGPVRAVPGLRLRGTRFVLESSTSRNYCNIHILYLLRLTTSSSVKNVIAFPGLPARPVRPVDTKECYIYKVCDHCRNMRDYLQIHTLPSF